MHERPRRRPQSTTTPFWRVMAVFDPDGTGQDFGYTVGLSTIGHPELHMWARPTHGSDPGHDFKLSPADIGAGLNRYALALLDGELEIGDQDEVVFDEGLSRATFTIGDPVIPDEVDAFAVDPDSLVIPLRWELHRHPEGENLPVSGEVGTSIEVLRLTWRSILEDLGGRPGTERGDTDPGQQFGPWSSVIDSMRATIALVGARGRLSWCIDQLEEDRGRIGHAMAIGSALARAHGRSAAFAAAEAAGMADGRSHLRRNDEMLLELADASAADLLGYVRSATGCILGACYALVVVRDLIEEPHRSLVHDPVREVCSDTAWLERFEAG